MSWKTSTGLPLAALLIGFAAGGLSHWLGEPSMLAAADLLEPVGSIWTSALRLLAWPLVVCVLVSGVAGFSGGRAFGRLGAISLLVFVAMLAAGAGLALLLTPSALSMMSIERLTATIADRPAQPASPMDAPSTITEWMKSMASFDPIESIARGEILPLVLIALFFALALARIEEAPRRAIVALFDAVVQTLFVMLSWLLLLAPVGVFALAYCMAARHGGGAAGVLGASIGVTIGLLVIMTAAMYPAAAIIGRVPLAGFARGLGPAQVVAVGTRSSLAALPALIAGSGRAGVPSHVAGFVLPLSAAVFKPSKAINSTAKLFVLAHAYDIELSPGAIAAFLITIILTSFGSPGVPTNASIQSIPVLLAAGMPLEGIILLNAVEAVPDVFKTLLNVTANMSAAAIVARLAGQRPAEAEIRTAAPPALAGPSG